MQMTAISMMATARWPWDSTDARMPAEAHDTTTQAAKDYCLDCCPYADSCECCDLCDGHGNLKARKNGRLYAYDPAQITRMVADYGVIHTSKLLGVGRTTLFRYLRDRRTT